MMTMIFLVGLFVTPCTKECSMPFKAALASVLVEEGGYYAGDKPHDPNPTQRGITQASYDDYTTRHGLVGGPVKDIPEDVLEAIYRERWDEIRGDELPTHTAAAVFDHAITAGGPSGVQVLQKALGLKADGRLGPITMSAVRTAVDPILAIAVSAYRVRYYCDLAVRKPKKLPALHSWINRTLNLQAQAIRDCH